MGHGHAVFEEDLAGAGVADLQKEGTVLFIGHYVRIAGQPLLLRGAAGAQRVFQRVGQQHTQVGFRHRQDLRDLGADLQRDGHILRPGVEGGENQVSRLVFAKGLHLSCFDLAADLMDILPGLRGSSVFNAGVQILHVVAQIMAVDTALPL